MSEISIIFLVIIFIVIFIIIRLMIQKYFIYTINKKLDIIFPHNENDKETIKLKTFKSIYNTDQSFTVDTFKSEFKVKQKKPILKIVKWGDDGFEIYSNENLIIRRKCLNGFYYTKNGCSNTQLCLNKPKDEIVGDDLRKHIFYQCDGHNGVKNVILDYNKNSKDIEVIDKINSDDKNKKVHGNCNSQISIPVNIPNTWSSSTMYKQCIDYFWNFKFCPKVNNFNNYSKVLEEIRDSFDLGILYRPLYVDSMVFDENEQKCNPFDYKKYYRNGEIPLVYNDRFMFEQSNVLPTMVYNTVTKKLITKKKSDFEDTNYNNQDKKECLTQYQEYVKNFGDFFGILTVAYSNIILSCRCGKPVNKIAIDKNQYPNFWNRSYFGEGSFTDGKHNIHICQNYLHKFIPTCVTDIECVNADSLIPFKSPSVGITENEKISFCSNMGQLQETLPEQIKLDKFCKDFKTIRVHPYYNIPIDCKNKRIHTNISHRDVITNTLKIKNDSIFKNDLNALNLHFFSGIEI